MVGGSDRTNDEIVRCLNSSMLRGQLDNRFPDKLIMMFLNRIYDLTNFTHPGGQYIWEWSRWRETSRYLIGAYGDEKDSRDYMDYTHSMDAYKMLDKSYIGKLEVFPAPETWAMWDRQTGKSAYSENIPWRKFKQTSISATTDIYEFTNEQYRMNTFYSGVEFFGKHYLVTFNSKSRNYTNCTCLSRNNISYRQNLMAAYANIVAKTGKTFETELDESTYTSNGLPLVVKVYEKKKIFGADTPLSWNMKNSDTDTEWVIDGPFGKGLELTSESRGHYVMLSAGTGFLPFADLLDFLLKKAIYCAAQKNGNKQLQEMVKPVQEYDEILKHASFSFYGAFSTIEDFVMRDEIELLHKICQENGFEWFDTKIRMSTRRSKAKAEPEPAKETLRPTISDDVESNIGNELAPNSEKKLVAEQSFSLGGDADRPLSCPGVKERFDDMDFLRSHCKKGDTIFTCGPPVMNTTIYKNLREIGFADYDIYLI